MLKKSAETWVKWRNLFRIHIMKSSLFLKSVKGDSSRHKKTGWFCIELDAVFFAEWKIVLVTGSAEILGFHSTTWVATCQKCKALLSLLERCKTFEASWKIASLFNLSHFSSRTICPWTEETIPNPQSVNNFWLGKQRLC